MKAGNYMGLSLRWDSEEEPKFLKKPGQKVQSFACEQCGYLEDYVKK